VAHQLTLSEQLAAMVNSRDLINIFKMNTQLDVLFLFIIGGGGIVFILGLVSAYMIASRTI
jgi:hypothetical protein